MKSFLPAQNASLISYFLHTALDFLAESSDADSEYYTISQLTEDGMEFDFPVIPIGNGTYSKAHVRYLQTKAVAFN